MVISKGIIMTYIHKYTMLDQSASHIVIMPRTSYIPSNIC